MTATATSEAPTRGSVRRWSRGSAAEKIQPWHWQRLAVVYVRQSTPQQVLDHQESTRLQYGLTERAVELGWAEAQVVVSGGRTSVVFTQLARTRDGARSVPAATGSD